MKEKIKKKSMKVKQKKIKKNAQKNSRRKKRKLVKLFSKCAFRKIIYLYMYIDENNPKYIFDDIFALLYTF